MKVKGPKTYLTLMLFMKMDNKLLLLIYFSSIILYFLKFQKIKLN